MRRSGVRGLVDFGRGKGRSLGRKLLLLGAIWSTLLLVGCEPHPCPRVAAPRPQPCPSTPPPSRVEPGSWIAPNESTVPSKDWRTRSHAGTTTCLADIGCPFEPAAIPSCPPTAETKDWQNAPDGSTVILRGRLQAVPGGKTQAKCSETDPCCNTQFGALTLYVGLALVLLQAPDPVDFACDGDITMLCCGFDSVGSEVLVRGTIGRARTIPRKGGDGNTVLVTLLATGLCRVESDQAR